ncbi:MAG: tetratricopeptide repeat protein [Promethearchaeota archaeon]|nr:MAG: tetratricopeptide repeat protein [Candidatus Lokiarchaeota archaeon]
MKSSFTIPKELDTLKFLFNQEEKYVFLAGAGISINPPSNLKSAREIVKSILKFCAPQDEIENMLNLNKLRYESIIEYIQLIYDEGLSFMDYFEYFKEPNLIHIFLANAIITRHHVITTNFDYLIENALIRVLPEEQCSRIVPMITKEDYLKNPNPNELCLKKLFPFIKIHGSKKNFFTQEDTTDSLITTISALGKGRAGRETFAIEPFKKVIINNVMKDRNLVVLGYSGNDDFDITPTLKELTNLKRLIWINHSFVNEPEIFKFEPLKYNKRSMDTSLLEEILWKIRQDNTFDVYLINGDTEKLISDILWDLLFPKIKIPKLDKKKSSDHIPKLSEFFKNKFKSVTEVNAYKFASLIFHSVGDIEKTKTLLDKVFNIAQKIKDLDSLGLISNNLGVVFLEMGKYDNALSYHLKALDIYRKLNDLEEETNTLNKIAFVYFSKNDYEMALKIFREVLDLTDKIADKKIRATCLTNLGELYRIKGEIEKALEKFEESLKINNELGRLSQKAATLNNIGMIYNIKNQFDKAYNIYKEAIEIAKQLGENQLEATILNNMGMNFKSQGKIENAIVNFNKSLNLFKILGFRYQIAGILNNMGVCYFSSDNLDLALKHYNEALEIYQKIDNKYGIALQFNNIGIIYKSQKQLELAREHLLKSLKLFEDLGLMENANLVKNELKTLN